MDFRAKKKFIEKLKYKKWYNIKKGRKLYYAFIKESKKFNLTEVERKCLCNIAYNELFCKRREYPVCYLDTTEEYEYAYNKRVQFSVLLKLTYLILFKLLLDTDDPIDNDLIIYGGDNND